MTKEELEKEAEVFVSEKADKGNFDIEQFGRAYFSESSMKQALVKFAEKQIAELELKIKHLTEQVEEEEVKQEQRIKELEAQIEKMRNFQNCDYQLHVIDCPIFKSGGHISCEKCPHWILQKTDE